MIPASGTGGQVDTKLIFGTIAARKKARQEKEGKVSRTYESKSQDSQ